MIVSFPVSNFDDVVTKDVLRAELGDQIGSVRGEIADLRLEMTTTFARETGSLRSDLGDFRHEMAEYTHNEIQKSLLWTIATMITLAGVISGFVLAVH